MHAALIVWLILATLAFIACLRYPGKLYIYLTSGLVAAAFMAFLGASISFQIILAILVMITAMIFGESGILNSLFLFVAIDIAVILIYYFIFRQ